MNKRECAAFIATVATHWLPPVVVVVGGAAGRCAVRGGAGGVRRDEGRQAAKNINVGWHHMKGWAVAAY